MPCPKPRRKKCDGSKNKIHIEKEKRIMERFHISTVINDGRIQYNLFDKKTEKMYVCGTGELNSLIWKLLGV